MSSLNKTLEPMERDAGYYAFRSFEKDIAIQVNKGQLSREQAKYYLDKARENYKEQRYNRELEKIKKQGILK